MRIFIKKNIRLFFLIVACLDIFAATFSVRNLHLIAKPLLIPLLIGLLLIHAESPRKFLLIIAGLCFSVTGDILLLGNDDQPAFFISGLICFLVTHIMYAMQFFKMRTYRTSLLRQKPVIIILITIYILAFIRLLYPTLGSLRVPVIIYAVVLGSMFLGSCYAYTCVSLRAGKLLIAGAACFVISDSILAINKFYTALPGAGGFIMLTYCLAQWLIVEGGIKTKFNYDGSIILQ